ncbi:hypothetical protein CALVIDRAFT_344067 [Calocera viscosa TUFC12733]|uniref:Uncharacterized protein n=1 Tax=Calocera viscosa (strain TUFC12733) TaxID=1330018 RepID=A0A167HCT1_CALVF|nr:hypothetical protein CALVIDRAFT_344067 [Calocera viscosa TUFC12733]
MRRMSTRTDLAVRRCQIWGNIGHRQFNGIIVAARYGQLWRNIGPRNDIIVAVRHGLRCVNVWRLNGVELSRLDHRSADNLPPPSDGCQVIDIQVADECTSTAR